MKTNLFALSAATLFLGLSVGASAATTTLTLNSVNKATLNESLKTITTSKITHTFGAAKTQTTINDVWDFKLAAHDNRNFTSIFTEINKGNVTGFSATLRDVTSNKDLPWTLSSTKPIFLKGGDEYQLIVKGSTVLLPGGNKGYGSFGYGSSTNLVAAVPEAEEWAMMVVGLGLVGMQVHRKSRSQSITTIGHAV